MTYTTPVQNLLKQSKNNPNKVYLHQPIERQWQKYTWTEVEHQARCIAKGLQSQGYEKGSRIGILSKNCAHWIISDLAIMMAGYIPVAIFSTAHHNTISFVIKHADLKAIFVGKLDDTSAAESAINTDILRIALPYPTVSTTESFTSWLSKYPPIENVHQASINDTATILYTSGSTGEPKGVVLTYKNWVSAAQITAIKFNMTSNDRQMSYLPLAHAVERSLEASSLFVGYEIYFVESLETFIEDLNYVKPTVFGSVPRLWSKFQSQILKSMPEKKLNFLISIPIINKIIAKKIKTKLGLECARYFASGTAPIPLSLLQWYEKLGINISEAWGMSETSSVSCINLPYVKSDLGTIGKPIDCVTMKLSKEGEILIKGDAIFSEYYRDTETTLESFTDGWFHTGDCGEITASGAFKIVGRIKDKFKTSKGKYVTPVPIESLLSANTDIDQVCVMGSGLKQPIAIVVLNNSISKENTEAVEKLKNILIDVNNELERHQKLDYILVCSDVWDIDNGLLTPTLKIKRNAIEQKYMQLINGELLGDIIWESDIASI